MGYIYKVAVPNANWPSARELDEALMKAGEPVRLIVEADRADSPFEIGSDERLAVMVGEIRHVVDSREYVFDRDNDTFELFDIMNDAGMDADRITDAHVYSVTTHADDLDWIVAKAIMRRLVLDFGGYGMDFQANLAGTTDWASTLDARFEDQKREYHAFIASLPTDEVASRIQ